MLARSLSEQQATSKPRRGPVTSSCLALACLCEIDADPLQQQQQQQQRSQSYGLAGCGSS